MKTRATLTRAMLFERADEGPLTADEIARLGRAPEAEGRAADLPAQVADILLAHGVIRDPRVVDGAAACLWIAERDWIYRIHFSGTPGLALTRLVCEGLDTVADLYLNGEPLAESRDMYLPLLADLAGRVRGDNVLLIHFHSPHRFLRRQTMPASWAGCVHRNRLLRKPHEDFNSFNGAFPYFTPVGVYAPIQIEQAAHATLEDVAVDYELDIQRPSVRLTVEANVAGARPDAPLSIRLRVTGPQGTLCLETTSPCSAGRTRLQPAIDRPSLWWPRALGEQALYEVSVELCAAGAVLDRATRVVGFREIRFDGSGELRINGRSMRLWGANLAPLEQFTHVWPSERVARLLDLAENAHVNSLRLWGPGAPYGRDLYEACDRRGILVWSELYHTWGMYPDLPDYIDLCRREAEHHVRTLRHHPCIFVWCGGNEVQMGAELSHPGRAVIGSEILHRVYPEVCARLDPRRHYHPDSPWGGAFANDPDAGDSHGYTHFWFVRGCDYPALLTENARWSPPQRRTLERYIPDASELWPDGFRSQVAHRRARMSGPGSPSTGLSNDGHVDHRDIHEGGLLPPAWQRLGKDGNITNRRAGPLGDFYETGDTPDGLIYRIGSAHSSFLRREIERLRRGRPPHQPCGPRRVRGHFWWRLNGTWPLIDSELIDYLLEPKMAYYAARRAQHPVLISFTMEDRIQVWVTNDSGYPIEAVLRVELLPMEGGPAVHKQEHRCSLAPDDSTVVATLDRAGMFRRELILAACLVDDAGTVLARVCDFAEIERNLVFPDPVLVLRKASPDTVVVTTDVFARCVELLGRAPDGDAFGWDFDDNFFDLIPGEVRSVRLLGRHRSGVITARAAFSERTTTLHLGEPAPLHSTPSR